MSMIHNYTESNAESQHGRKSQSNQWLIGTLVLLLMTSLAVKDVMGQEVSPAERLRDIGVEVYEGMTIAEAKAAAGDSWQDEHGAMAERDSLALVSFYHSTNGDNWDDNSGWLQEGQPAWSWYGLGDSWVRLIDDEWRVYRFELRNNNLTGTFPDDFSTFDELWRVVMDRNNMHGDFPDVLTEMGDPWRFVDIGFNYFSGVPNWVGMGRIPNMQQWKMGANYFTGTVPDFEEGSWPSLTIFQIQNNLFEGPLPGGTENLVNLRWFRGQNNRFTGSLDVLAPLGDIDSVTEINLGGNYGLEEGPIPEWLMNAAENMEVINFAGTNRTGQIPSWFGLMSELERVNLGGGDAIGGPLPDEMINMSNLERLTLTKGTFSGPIPEWLPQMPSMERLHLEKNAFTGQIPSTIVGSNMEVITLIDLQLDGPLPDLTGTPISELELDNIGFEITEFPGFISNLSGLEDLRLKNLGITGNLPDLSNLVDLEVLELEGNPIEGDGIPSWIAGLPELESLNLNRTNITISEFPSFFQNRADDMRRIELAGVGMQGSIPSWIGQLQWLTRLVLDDNELTGSLPWQLGNLTQMDSLNVANNNLSGNLHESIASMGVFEDITNLNSFVVSGNADLEGEIPMDVTNWDPIVLRVLWFDGTGLCEPDSDEFRTWLDEVATPFDPNDHMTMVDVRSTDNVCGDDPPVSTTVPDQPYTFNLEQNYPNPFNPTTTIQYELPAEMHVTLHVYNVLGQRVATLVNETVSMGRHDVNFDASGFSSGTYIYRLQTDDRTLTQTMMLVK